jgi:hypothetical protein
MNDINYQVAADAAIILKYGGVDQSVVKGLNKLKPYGFTRNVITVEEFRNEMGRQFAGSGQMSNIEFGGNYVTGDVKGQDQLKAYMLANTKFTDCRCYLNNDDFFMPDVAQDPLAAFQVVNHSPGEADKNGVFPFSGGFVLNGRPATFHIHKTAATLAIVAGTPDTITDTGSGFVTAGFKAGDTIILEGVTEEDDELKMRVVASVAAGILTLSNTVADLTDQAAGIAFTIHGGRF